MPSGAPAAASVGPCSMCASTKHAGRRLEPAGRRQLAVAERGEGLRERDAVGVEQIALALLEHAAERAAAEAPDAEARALLEAEGHDRERAAGRAAGARSPRRRRAPAACRARRRSGPRRAGCRGASRSRPPAGSGSLPRSRPERLPAASNATSSPASRIQPATSSNARCSPGPRPSRFVPAARPISKRTSSRSRMRLARASGVAAPRASDADPRSPLTEPSMSRARRRPGHLGQGVGPGRVQSRRGRRPAVPSPPSGRTLERGAGERARARMGSDPIRAVYFAASGCTPPAPRRRR